MPAPDVRLGVEVVHLFRISSLAVAMVTITSTGWSDGFRFGDLNGDDRIGQADLDHLLQAWDQDPNVVLDLDGDGRITAGDVAVLAAAWDPWSLEGTASRQVARPLGTTSADQGYWEYLPEAYLQRDDWPLLVFLHGKGENGDGSALALQRVLVHGPPALISANAWPVPDSAIGDEFVVLSPQHSGDRDRCHSGDDVAAFLEWAIDRYDVDPDRVYLTGLSCGGYGIWEYLAGSDARVPGSLAAAVVPICGDGRPTWHRLGCDLGRTPIWSFHGDADRVVPIAGSDVPMEGLDGCDPTGVRDARYTIYPGVGHDSWTRTYDLRAGHDVYAWLHSHRRPRREPVGIPE